MTSDGNREHSAGSAEIRRDRKCQGCDRAGSIGAHPRVSREGALDYECYVPPNFGFHPLTGDRAGEFAITVTRNWRLTFTKVDDQTIADLDLEDFH
jgi:hypothetical protein